MNSKLKIAQTAFDLFITNGYKASTMSELVKQSGLSKGAFYHYFKSKQAVYDYVLEHYFLKYYQEVNWQDFAELNYKSFEAVLNSYYSSLLNEIRELSHNNFSNYFILFFEAYKNNAEFKKTIREFYKRLENIIIKKLLSEQITKEKAKLMAIKLIAKYEGFLFYLAIFPEKSEQINILEDF